MLVHDFGGEKLRYMHDLMGCDTFIYIYIFTVYIHTYICFFNIHNIFMLPLI